MFRCQMCTQVVAAGVKSQKLVVATREKQYPSRGADPAMSRFRRRFVKKAPYDKGGSGREIARELQVCPTCAASHAAQQQEAPVGE